MERINLNGKELRGLAAEIASKNLPRSEQEPFVKFCIVLFKTKQSFGEYISDIDFGHLTEKAKITFINECIDFWHNTPVKPVGYNYKRWHEKQV